MNDVDVEIEKRTRDFRVVTGGDIKKRPHRHTRREDMQPLSRSEIEEQRSEPLRRRDQQRADLDAIEGATDGNTNPQEPQGGDIKPDWQALRRHGSAQPARPQGEIQVLTEKPLTRAQRKELQQVKAEKLFGREPRKV